MDRQIPIRRTAAGQIECDVCPQPATKVSPGGKNRELAFYCDYDAKRSVGWPERVIDIEEWKEGSDGRHA